MIEVAPRLSTLSKQVIHGGAGDRNILLDQQGLVSGLIDFGDLVETWRVNELAIAAATVAIGAADPIAAILPLVEAWCAENPIGAVEADLLFDLILTRYAVGMTMAARHSSALHDVWTALTAMQALNRPLAVPAPAPCGRFFAMNRWPSAARSRPDPEARP